MKGAMLASLRGGRLGQRLRITGSSALAGSTILQNLVRIVSTMCLTRLLAPDVYGIVGMIASTLYVINMLSDVGFQSYVVRHHRTDEQEFLSSVWTIHAVRGVLLTGVGIIVAWPVSLVLAKPELAAPLMVTAFTFAIEGQQSLNQFRALREGRVQKLALMDLTIGVSQTIAAIIFAFFIRNVWAIVAAGLVGSSVRVCMSYVLFPGGRHSFRPDREVAADLWRFSRMIAGSSVVYLIITQVDKLAMARILSLTQFGTYMIASTLAAAPMAFAFSYTSGIVYPATAAAWRAGHSVSDAYYRCWGRFFYLYAFGGGVLIGAADLIIRFLYDPRYLPSARYLSILAIATAMAMVTRAMQEVMIANGRTQALFELHMVRLTWLIAGGLLALAYYNAMILVLTIGLMEIPVYFYGCWQMRRQHLLRWKRELTLPLTIGAGLLVGGAMTVLGRILLPNL
jgi:O-antigen/teichoic acid export membrane protein